MKTFFFFSDHHNFGRKIAKLEIKKNVGRKSLSPDFLGRVKKYLRTLVLEITRFLRRKLDSVYRSGSLSHLGLESGPQYEKG